MISSKGWFASIGSCTRIVSSCPLLPRAYFNGSSKYAEQTLGINFMNALKLNLGYTIPYKANYFKGLTLGLSISFSKSNGYYDHLKIGF